MNPELINLFGLSIRWYSVLILIGAALGIFILKKEAQRFEMSWDFVFNLSFWTLIFGIIGARIYFVIFHWSEYSSDLLEIFKVWNGGLAIHGGLIAGAITAFFYCKKNKANTLKVIDMALPSVILAQAIGRWGNFFNGEAHGIATSLAKLQSLHIPRFIIDGMYIDGVYYHPTFLYESLLNLICFIVLMVLRRNKKIRLGIITGIYFMWYGVVRFFIESLRTDALMLGSLRMAQVISIVLFIIGLVLVILSHKKDKYNKEVTK